MSAEIIVDRRIGATQPNRWYPRQDRTGRPYQPAWMQEVIRIRERQERDRRRSGK